MIKYPSRQQNDNKILTQKCLIHLLKTTVWLSLVFTAFGLFKPFFKCKEIFENRMCLTV